MGSDAKSYLRKGFLIYEEMRKYLTIYEEAVSRIWLCTRSHLHFLIYEENLFSFISVNARNMELFAFYPKLGEYDVKIGRNLSFHPKFLWQPCSRIHRSCTEVVKASFKVGLKWG